MAKGNSRKQSNDSGRNFEAQLTSDSFIKYKPQRAEALGDMNVAAGAPVSDPARFKVAVTNTPDRRSALRFTERCRIPRNADSFRTDLHPNLKPDLILANPRYNVSTTRKFNCCRVWLNETQRFSLARKSIVLSST